MFGRVVVCGTRRWSIRRQFKWRFDQQKIEYRWQISNRGEVEMFESKDWSSENIWEGISCLDPINVSLSFPLHHQRRRSSFSLIKFTLDWKGICFFLCPAFRQIFTKREWIRDSLAARAVILAIFKLNHSWMNLLCLPVGGCCSESKTERRHWL